MKDVKRVRVIKGGRAAAQSSCAVEAAREPVRETRDVVSDWVREHRRRSEEFRQNYSSLLERLGLSSPLSCRAR
jgi:hypothetical protein